MTERKPPRDPLMPPPIPQQLPQQAARQVTPQARMQPAPPRVEARLDTVRPGIDRPEDRPVTLGRPANRQQIRPLPPRPTYDPNQPPIGRTSRSAPEPRKTGWIWAFGLSVAGLATLAGAGAAYLAFAPPIGMIRDQMIAQVKAKTGRDLNIGGPTTLTVGPGLGLSIRDVTLSAAPAMGGEPLVTMAELTANVRIWPLLMRRVSVDSVVVKQPVFDLRVDAAGKRSWDFAGIAPEVLVQYAQAAADKTTATTTATDGLPDAVKDFVNNASDPDNPSPQMKAKLAKLEELTLGDVRIEGGTVQYSDARNGAHLVASGIDTQVKLDSLASPLDASGKLDYQGQTVAFAVKLASPKAIIEDRPAKLAFSLSGPPVEVKYDGTVTARAAIDFEGDVSANAQSLRRLVAWLGHELPPADGFGPVAASGKLKVSGTSYALNLTTLGLDGATASGTVLVDASGGARPRVTANLRISELDLNKYSLAAGKAIPAVAKPLPVRPAGGPKAMNGTTAKSIEDLINGSDAAGGPKVKGYTKRAGWSTEPIALDGLGLLDLDAKLAVGKLLYHEIKVGQSAVTVALKGKVLRANFDDVQLYDGLGRGFISIDANAQPPVMGGNMSVDGVAAANILKDVADFELLAGAARMSVAIGAQGTSEAELVATANGKADFAFTNGAIVGYNIPGTVRGLMQGRFSGFDRVPGEKTDFSELAASFTIANGVATNQDLRLTGPALRVSGAGQIQLPAQAVDYTVKPKVTAALLGQSGGVAEALGSGVDVPVRITGPWAKPHFAADSAAALKDPKNIEAAKEIGRKLKDNGTVKEIGSALKGLLSKGGDAGDGGAKPNPKQMLEKLFKKKEAAPN